MKRSIFVLVWIIIITLLCSCGSKVDNGENAQNTETTPQTTESTKHTISSNVLDDALSSCKYSVNPFSISVGKLVNSAMDDYSITYLHGEEIITQGYLKKSQIDSSIDLDFLYYAIISGDTMMNPDYPYMTSYEEEALTAWMVFDEYDHLENYGVSLCENLETCAALIMYSSF